ncbi:MAG: VOC family protein [Hyphomicrobiales bacterium]|nr:VOC family protein [Hyphomicrobiales bacterium]MDE2016403.1 VOC family protein [Hyphomicrobiales bacterium]
MAIGVPRITPHLWFDTQAVEAAEFYASVFPNSRIDKIDRIRDTPSGDCDIVSFTLADQPFMAISAGPMFKFNEAISLVVPCDTQEEIDHYWSRLAADPAAGRCGWIKDRYGLSWQIWPKAIAQMMEGADSTAKARVTRAIMASKKFEIVELRRALAGE